MIGKKISKDEGMLNVLESRNFSGSAAVIKI